MGILNTTPDSFSDGGKFISAQKAVDRMAEMAEQGATIIDIGGESTRPGGDPVSEEEELQRVIPVLEEGSRKFPQLFFSVDTTKFKVAREELKAGAHIINDVSGLGAEPRLADLCSEAEDQKSTRLNSSHVAISYAVFCLKKKISRALAIERAQ